MSANIQHSINGGIYKYVLFDRTKWVEKNYYKSSSEQTKKTSTKFFNTAKKGRLLSLPICSILTINFWHTIQKKKENLSENGVNQLVYG